LTNIRETVAMSNLHLNEFSPVLRKYSNMIIDKKTNRDSSIDIVINPVKNHSYRK